MIEKISDEYIDRASNQLQLEVAKASIRGSVDWREMVKAILEASGAVFLTDEERQALVWACRQPERAAKERQIFSNGSHALAFESARAKLS